MTNINVDAMKKGRRVMLAWVGGVSLLLTAYAVVFGAGLTGTSLGYVLSESVKDAELLTCWLTVLAGAFATAWGLGGWAGRIAARRGRLFALGASTAVTFACLGVAAVLFTLQQALAGAPALQPGEATLAARADQFATCLLFGSVPALFTGLLAGWFLPRQPA